VTLASNVDALADRIADEFNDVRGEITTGLAGKANTGAAPTAHAASHATGGTDAITAASIGASTSGHSHPSYVSTSRTVTAGTGLTGGGDLSANRTLAVAYGTSAGTAVQGSSVGAASGVASLDSTTRVPAAQMPRVPSTVRTVTYSATPTVDPTTDGNLVSITATGNITSLAVSTTGAVNRQALEIAVLGSGGTRTVTFASAIRTSTGVTRGPHSVASGEVGIFLVKYYTLVSAWVLVAATVSAA
jgi:hypothetical protein